MSSITIRFVELDDGNLPQVTRHGVTISEVETLLFSATRFYRNKRSAAGHYAVLANGVRVNFIYRAEDEAARPISAWRIR